MQSRPSIYKSALLAALLTSLIGCGGSSGGSKNSSSTSVTSSSSSFSSSSISSAVTSYNLTYGASAGGSISGQTSQDVAAGSSGSSVTAIPAANYRFTGWSDGSLKATRTDSNIQQSATLTANFAPENIWSTAPYSGAMSLEVLGPRSVNVIWDDNEPRTIMVISEGITAEVSIGAPEGVSWHVGVTSPFKLENLKADIPIYVALQQDDAITAWSSTTPRKLIVDGEIKTIQQMENGNIFLGGDFEYIAPDHGSAVLLPSASSGITNPTPLAFPHVNGLVYSAVDDGQGGWFIGGNFTKVGNHEKPGFAHIDQMGQVLPWQPVEGDIRQIKKRNDVLYIGGTYKTALNPALVAVSAFKINNNTPEFHVELATPVEDDQRLQPLTVYQIELSSTRIYISGYMPPHKNVMAIDYSGNILNWPQQNSIQLSAPAGIALLGNDVYARVSDGFLSSEFFKANAGGEVTPLTFGLPQERVYRFYGDSEYLYARIQFNPTSNHQQSANHIQIDEAGNIRFLTLPLTDGIVSIYKGMMYYSKYWGDDYEGQEQPEVLAYSLIEEKKINWSSPSYPHTIFVSDDTVLISADPILVGKSYRPGQALLNQNEELLP